MSVCAHTRIANSAVGFPRFVTFHTSATVGPSTGRYVMPFARSSTQARIPCQRESGQSIADNSSAPVTTRSPNRASTPASVVTFGRPALQPLVAQKTESLVAINTSIQTT